MAYGNLKADTLIYSTPTGDITQPVSGLYGTTSATGIFTTLVSGATITGTTGNFTQLNATNISGSISGYAVLSGAQTFTGGQRGNVNVVAYATGIQLDLATSNNFQITLTGNTTLQNPTGVVSGQAGTVAIIQGTGNNTMAFGSNWHYPGGSGSVPSLTTASGSTDILAYYVVNSTKIAYRLVQDIKA